jgi:hypothetical protein
MATSITVFDIVEDEVVLNKSQKQLEYEDLGASAKIASHHFSTLLEIDEYLEQKEKPKSNISSILLKYVLQYCAPIVTTSVDGKFSISLQHEQPTMCVLDGKNAIIPADKQFHVVGIKIPNIFIRHYSFYKLSHFDKMSDKDLFTSGLYGLYDLDTLKYTQQRESFTHPGKPEIEELQNKDTDDIIIFTNEAQVMSIVNKIILYIDFIESFYNINFPIISLDITLEEFKNPNTKWQIINGKIVSGKDDVKAIPTKGPVAMKDFSPKLLDILNNIQPSKFGKSFYFDILFMLDKNKLVHTYHIGNSIGVDDPIFKKEYAELKDQIDYTAEYDKQVQAAHVYYNNMSRMRIIAFNKYGIKDLAALDDKQRKIVELEHKKTELAMDESTNEVQKLFYRLQKTFHDLKSDRLKEALTAIEKSISKADLNKDLLLQGGACPHLYHYGKQLLEDFGKPWANTNIKNNVISKYSLPQTTSGYYCKICGEKLSDFDTATSLVFTGEKGSIGMSAMEDDPIQTMIWKEAMYIVSANVRFKEPIPIKPLVSSIANGLRSIISNEESKLYRSKTTSADSIRDTLNLYASIYIYAALCAIMVSNPGKMLFARDKPQDMREKEKRMEAIETRRPINNRKIDEKDKFGVSEDVDYSADNSDNDEPIIDYNSDTEFPKEFPKEHVVSAAGERTRRIKNKKYHRYAVGGKVILTDNVKKAESHIIKNALILLIISKDAIISRLKHVSIPIIRNIFGTAYKWAITHAKPINIESAQAGSTEDPIAQQAFYSYLHYSLQLNSFSNKLSSTPNIDDVNTLLGRDKDQLIQDLVEKNIDIYADVKPVEQWHFPPKIGRSPEYQKFFDRYTYLSYLSMYEFIHNKLYRLSYMPPDIQIREHLDKFKPLLDDEFKVRMQMAKDKLKPMLELKLISNIMWKYNRFKSSELDLAQHYCLTGENHKIGSYLYSMPNTTGITEITKADITEWLDKKDNDKINKFNKMTLVNERCSRCKKTIRDATSTDKSDKALANMFKKIDDILAFYQYFESRCPKGNLHDIVNNKCNKCGFITDHIKTVDIEFYNKYADQFKKILIEQQRLTIKSLEHIKETKPVDITKKPEKYIFSLKKTARWSQLANIKYNIIANVGLSEGIKYEDIEKSKIDPSKEPYSFRTRSLKLKGYIRQILRDYSLLVNHEQLVELPLSLKEIVTSQKNVDLNNFIKLMPKFDKFTEVEAKYQYVYNDSEYANFLQEYLATLISDLGEIESEKYKPLATLLIKYFTTRIIDQDKMMSKSTPVYYIKRDITGIESATEDEVLVSGDEYNTRQEFSEKEDISGIEDNAIESNEENTFDLEGMDVENVEDIYEVD